MSIHGNHNGTPGAPPEPHSPDSRPRRRDPIHFNLLLTIILVVVGIFAYWYEFKEQPKQKRADEAKTKLFVLDQGDEVESLNLVDQDKKIDTKLVCKEGCRLSDPNGKWEITSPISFRGDEGSIGSFISSLSAASIFETVPLEGDVEKQLANYGLSVDKRDRKKAVFKLKKLPAPYTVYFGENSPVGENAFVYVTGPGFKGDKVQIIPANLKDPLARGLGYWRSKRLFDLAASEIDRLKLTNGNGKFTLQKENGDWFIAAAVRQPADNQTVDTFLTGLVFMNAHDYVSDDKQKDRAKLKISGSPKYSLEIHSNHKGLETTTLEIYEVGKPGESKIYGMLANKGFIVELDRAGVQKFGKSSSDFKFRHVLTHAEKLLIRKVSITMRSNQKNAKGAERLVFESSDGAKWRVASGSAKVDGFDSDTLEKILLRLESIRFADFLNAKALPKDVIGNAWKLQDKDGKFTKGFTVYTEPGKETGYLQLDQGDLVRLERGGSGVLPTRTEDFKKMSPK